MRLAEGTRVTFQQKEVVALASSGILTVTVGGTVIAEGQAYLLEYIRPDAAPNITAVSSSGYELECLSIEDEEWEWAITKEPEPEEA